MEGSFIIAIAIIVFIFIFLQTSIKIIRPSEKGIVERLGKLQGIRDSGITLLIPFMDKLRKIDIREQAIDVPSQEVICSDNVVVTVDCIVYIQIVDPIRALYNIYDVRYAVTKLAQTNLRAEIGKMTLDQTLSARDNINTQLRIELDESTDAWGVRVQRVEVQRIDPPQDVVQAMHQQMRAEREKRAEILKAEGLRQSAILEAEGQKQAEILKAEGDKFAQIRQAEGLAKSIQLESEAAIAYFKDGAVTKEQLKVMTESFQNNTKYVVGTDIADTLKGLFSHFKK